VSSVVDQLLEAERDCRELQPFSAAGGFTVDEAYAMQDELVARKLDGDDVVIGAKLGLTSKAKQRTMNVGTPCFGQLLASQLLSADEPVRLDELIHPRVEPEIVFHLRDALAGPGVTAHDVLAATAAIGCGLEVIDSRYAAFKFTLADVVADNTSAARFVLGERRVDPADIPDLSLVGCVLEKDGQGVATAAGAAVLGHPADAVALLANWLGRKGRRLEPGWVVLSGGMTDAVPLTPGCTVTATFGRLGTVRVRAV
jgi:2-oxo-3-hexenedioate decarboxylase